MFRRTALLATVSILASVTQAYATGTGPTQFAPNEDWTHGPYFGSRGTFFADVDGDWRADAIVVNDDTITVRRSNGTSFQSNEDWTRGPFFGSRGTFFADVDGDGKADAIAINDDTITVRRSTADCFLFCWNYHFGPNEDWSGGPYYGAVGTFFADVDGDGRADAIAVNADGVYVRLSTGRGFGPTRQWIAGRYGGTAATFFFDIDGDGKADAIAINGAPGDLSSNILVRLSNGSGFGAEQNWLMQGPAVGFGTRFLAIAASDDYGAPAPLLAAVADSGVWVRKGTPLNSPPPGTPQVFGPASNWTGGAYFGTLGTFFADVTGDRRADAIVVNQDTITVRRATPESLGPAY